MYAYVLSPSNAAKCVAVVVAATGAVGCEAIAGVHDRDWIGAGGQPTANATTGAAGASSAVSTGGDVGGAGGTGGAGAGGQPPGCLGATTSATLAIDGDTELSDQSVTTSYGAQDHVLVDAPGAGDMNTQVGLFHFALSGLSASTVVCSVALDAYAIFGSTQAFTVHEVLESWTESAATWQARDGSTSWISAGCGAGSCGDAIATPTPTCAQGPCGDAMDVTFDLGLELVNAWLSGQSPNNGFALKAVTSNGIELASREDATHAPTVTIVYVAPQ